MTASARFDPAEGVEGDVGDEGERGNFPEDESIPVTWASPSLEYLIPGVEDGEPA